MLDEKILLDVLDTMTDQVIIINNKGVIDLVNKAWKHFRREHKLPENCIGNRYDEVFAEEGITTDIIERAQAAVRAILAGSLASYQFKYSCQMISRKLWFTLNISPIGKGKQGALITQTNITRQTILEIDLLAKANQDELTRIANRRFFLLEGAHMLALAKRYKWSGALIYCDLDNFKSVNDTYGHEVGDAVLCRVSERLQRQTRESDLLARLGGDEFVMLLINIPIKNYMQTMNAYSKSLAQPLKIKGKTITLQGSFGVSLYPRDGLTLSALLIEADKAMYHAKKLQATPQTQRIPFIKEIYKGIRSASSSASSSSGGIAND